MLIVEYMQSLLATLGVTPDKLPLFIAAISAAVALMYARPFFGRLGRVIESIFLRNWQLGLLGTTGLVLSLASGWTTWDGMKNFTGEPILSAMVTFGIQGVMLIVAWLIGESFATGMNQQVPQRQGTSAGGVSTFSTNHNLQFAAGLTLIGIALVAIGTFVLVMRGKGPDANQMAHWLTYTGAAVFLSGLLVIAARAHTLRGYFAATRVIIRTAVLWVMFLACMATSVFFSFDSLFSTIFPQSERVRAAELRAQNQVSGIIADIGGTITRGLLDETDHLFATEGWKTYDEQLSKLSIAAQGSRQVIEDYFQGQMEERRRGIAQQQERIATAQSGTVGLASKKLSMTDELARLKADRPALAEDYSKRKSDVDTIVKDLDAKRVDALAEARGVEGTGKVGEGAIFRQRKAEEQALKDKQKIAGERLSDAQKRFQQVETRLTQIERELSLIDGDIAKLKGEEQTAQQRIKLAEDAKGSEEAPRLDPTRIIPAFEKARAEFRQTPKIEGLAQVQTMCGQLVQSMATPATKDKVRGIDCDPKTAAEAAGRVFALNAGLVTFHANCAGGDKLNQYKSADDLFGFARKCVQDSGLGSKDTDELRQKINFIELNRDDKANRFVVTWNAFSDGNRLAYLSLAIAIAVDGLVFMSGLFGANAVRSPLSDVPTLKARSAEQLEGIIDNALLPHKFENARIAIEAMHADTSVPGYTAIVDLRELDPQSETAVRRVLNAGATIGAVMRNPDQPAVYAIRPELFEYLSITGARAFEKNGKLVKEDIAEKVRQGELEKMVRVALLPDLQTGAEAVMSYAHPMNVSDDGFMSEILMHEVKPDHMLTVRGVLNAGAAHNAVRRQLGEAGRYELHADLYKTLGRIRARMLLGASSSALQLGRDAVRDGGQLTTAPPQTGNPALRATALAGPQRSAGRDAGPEVGRDGGQDVWRRELRRDYGIDAGSATPSNDAPTPRAVEAARRDQNARRGAEAERSAVAMPANPSDSPEFDRDLCEHFAREMLTFHPDQLAYVRDQSPTIDVQALEMALANIMRFDTPIQKALQEAKTALEDSIEVGRNSFEGFAAGPADAARRLNDFADGLKRLTALMVLMPGQAYGNIISKREAGLTDEELAMRLDPANARRLELLRLHMKELANAPQSADHWQSVGLSLNAFGRGLATVAAIANQ